MNRLQTFINLPCFNVYGVNYYVMTRANIKDRRGKNRKVSLAINPDKGTYNGGDLYVFGDVKDCEKDGIFIEGVMRVLRRLGYGGDKFGRAEMGMQTNFYIVLEGKPEFREFCKNYEVDLLKKVPLEELPLYIGVHTVKGRRKLQSLLKKG